MSRLTLHSLLLDLNLNLMTTNNLINSDVGHCKN